MAEAAACPGCEGRTWVWAPTSPSDGPPTVWVVQCPECRGTGVAPEPPGAADEPFIAHEKETT